MLKNELRGVISLSMQLSLFLSYGFLSPFCYRGSRRPLHKQSSWSLPLMLKNELRGVISLSMQLSLFLSYGFLSPFFCADTDTLNKIENKDLTIAHFACLSAFCNSFDRGLHKVFVDGNFKSYLSQKIAHFLDSSVNLSDTHLSA